MKVRTMNYLPITVQSVKPKALQKVMKDISLITSLVTNDASFNFSSDRLSSGFLFCTIKHLSIVVLAQIKTQVGLLNSINFNTLSSVSIDLAKMHHISFRMSGLFVLDIEINKSPYKWSKTTITFSSFAFIRKRNAGIPESFALFGKSYASICESFLFIRDFL